VFGIHTVPKRPASHRTAVLILNTAAVHHVGTYRVSVMVARRLAQEGIASFRFDYGGVGDSPSVPGRPDNAFDRVDLVPDVRRCVDWLAAQGYREVVVYGLCSGAWLGYHAALQEPRISGAILLNLQNLWEGSRTARKFESNRRYLSLLRDGKTWRRLVKGEIDVVGISHVLASRVVEAAKARFERLTGRITGSETTADRTRRELRGLASRGAQTAIIFVGTETGLEEMELHFGEHGRDLATEPGVTVTIIPEGDHLFSTKASRDALLQLLAAQFRDGRFIPVARQPEPAADLRAPDLVGAAAVLSLERP
jgi:alpha/beta superfamily hydrolase